MNSEGPSDHLESLLFATISTGFRLVMMTCGLNSDYCRLHVVREIQEKQERRNCQELGHSQVSSEQQ